MQNVHTSTFESKPYLSAGIKYELPTGILSKWATSLCLHVLRRVHVDQTAWNIIVSNLCSPCRT